MESRNIYHFIRTAELDQCLRDGELRVSSLDSLGFIHCSTQEQVVKVANFLDPKRDDLVLLEIDEAKVIANVVYENLEGGDKLFPHVYGPLNADAIIATHPFVWVPGVGYELPDR
jgi:uncharacterized protein (DUF952 family)